MTRSFRISSRDVRSLVLTIAAVAVGSGFAGSGQSCAAAGEQPVSARIRRFTNSAW